MHDTDHWIGGAEMWASVRSLVPAPVRALRWRAAWMRDTPAHDASPLGCWARAIGFTLRELAGGEFRFRTPDGLVMRTMPNNFSSFAMAVAGARDPGIWRFIASRLRPGMVFVDAGANIGAYTLPAARLVGPIGQVIAFEAHPLTFATLRQNLAANALTNVTAINQALGEAPGTVAVCFTPANPGETHVATGGEAGVSVAVTALDEALDARGIAAVDYLKIDVEGFELQVLHGARRTIRRSPTIVVQTELQERHARRYGHGVNAVVNLLREEGLAPHVVGGDGGLRPIAGATRGDILWLRAP